MPVVPLESLSKPEIIDRLTGIIRAGDEKIAVLADRAVVRLEDYHRVKLERDGLLNLFVRSREEYGVQAGPGPWAVVPLVPVGCGGWHPTREQAETVLLKAAVESLHPRTVAAEDAATGTNDDLRHVTSPMVMLRRLSDAMQAASFDCDLSLRLTDMLDDVQMTLEAYDPNRD